jgi:formate dehydrogenase maturation protein FdhE
MVQSSDMETSAPPPFPPMPREYYHRQAKRVRKLAQEATTPDIREHLADVAREYEQLAEEAEADARETHRGD